MRLLLLLSLTFFCAISPSWAQNGYGCEANIPDRLKVDCHPDPDSSEERCRDRGCVWCESPDTDGRVPWCFNYNPEATTPPGPPPGHGCDDNYLPGDERDDCAPNENIEKWDCRARNCTWCPAANAPSCYHYKLPSADGYMMVGEPIQITNGLRVNLQKAVDNQTHTLTQRPRLQWEGEAETLTLDATFDSNYRLHVKIYPEEDRWEVPLEILPPAGDRNDLLYEVKFKNDPLFSFQVVRKSTGTVLFDSSPGKFIFADQYLTLSWRPASENVYGVGENEQPSFKHDFSKNLQWILWGKDQPPQFNANMYGVQPYLTVLEEDGNAHSVAVVNSNAQEFTMLSGGIIKYITIGGILEFYFFLGPKPEEVVSQYTEAVGRPPIPPYWSLGFQLCRFGYNTLDNMKAARDRTKQAGIPQDVQYGDIDIMDRRLDFTYAQDRFAGLPEYIRELKTEGVKFVTILDPCISTGEDPANYKPLRTGNEMDVWVKKPDGTPVVGRVWPEAPVYFPDYSKNATREWWIGLIREFHDLLEWDGLWIDMNEPANFVEGDVNGGCPQNNLNNPPYVPPVQGGKLSTMTLCPDHVHAAGNHYDTHSLFGWFSSEPTLLGARAGTGKRSAVLSRSTYLGSGRWVAHWLGDNYSNWPNMYKSVIGMLQYNQFGIPFNGADICGFLGDTNKELCQRWQELGAFYPFSRNHNVDTARDQDPAVWGEDVALSTRNSMLIRYTLLPYLYTLFYNAYVNGGTVATPLWHNYPQDPNTWDLDTQFMWGSGLLISPVLDEGSVEKVAYFPNNRFYNYKDGKEEETKGDYVTIPTPMDQINVHVAGGNVLPFQEPEMTTELARQNPYGLIVALDAEQTAEGMLFNDDGDSIDTVENGQYFLARYEAGNGTLKAEVVRDGYEDMGSKQLNTVRLMGVVGDVTEIRVNGNQHSGFTKQPSGEVTIEELGLGMTEPFEISWTVA